MAFPSSPTEGQEHNDGQKVWYWKNGSWRFRSPAPDAPLDADLDGIPDELQAALAGQYAPIDESGPRTALYLPGTSGNYVSTPDFALGAEDIDLIALISPTTWIPAAAGFIVGKRNPTVSFQWAILNNGRLLLRVANAAGTNRDNTSTTTVGGVDGTPLWVRATFDGNNGASGSTANFYKADFDGTLDVPTSWTQIGSTVTTATAWTIRDTADQVEIGSVIGGTTELLAGSFYRVVIRNVIDGPTVADWRGDVPASRYVDSTGKLWTVNGGASGWRIPPPLA